MDVKYRIVLWVSALFGLSLLVGALGSYFISRDIDNILQSAIAITRSAAFFILSVGRENFGLAVLLNLGAYVQPFLERIEMMPHIMSFHVSLFAALSAAIPGLLTVLFVKIFGESFDRRKGKRGYAMALLVFVYLFSVPLLFGVLSGKLEFVVPEMNEDFFYQLPVLVAVPIIGAFSYEVGFRAYLLPKMMDYLGARTSLLIIGVISAVVASIPLWLETSAIAEVVAARALEFAGSLPEFGLIPGQVVSSRAISLITPVCLSVVYGYFFLRYGSIKAPILLHALTELNPFFQCFLKDLSSPLFMRMGFYEIISLIVVLAFTVYILLVPGWSELDPA